MNARVHLSVLGFLKLASFINKLNNPLSDSLVAKLLDLGPLPDVEFETKSSLSEMGNLNPFLLSGFITGEGCFTYFARSRTTAANIIVKDYSLVFEVSQR